jgi:hypothetical protein
MITIMGPTRLVLLLKIVCMLTVGHPMTFSARSVREDFGLTTLISDAKHAVRVGMGNMCLGLVRDTLTQFVLRATPMLVDLVKLDG